MMPGDKISIWAHTSLPGLVSGQCGHTGYNRQLASLCRLWLTLIIFTLNIWNSNYVSQKTSPKQSKEAMKHFTKKEVVWECLQVIKRSAVAGMVRCRANVRALSLIAARQSWSPPGAKQLCLLISCVPLQPGPGHTVELYSDISDAAAGDCVKMMAAEWKPGND